MPSEEILKYFDATEFREIRDDLRLGVSLVSGLRTAIDCGCGAGSDIAFLRDNGFKVHAFDIEPEAIARCQERFRGDNSITLTQSSFSAFDYPSASLIVADASLFFCPQSEFAEVWNKICSALLPGGIFVGSFLGPEDTMAGDDYDRDAFWPDILVATEQMVRKWLESFEIVSFYEHHKSGTEPGGGQHEWHIYSVVARKEFNKAINPAYGWKTLMLTDRKEMDVIKDN